MEQSMRILVTGANGQVGHELLSAIPGGFAREGMENALNSSLSGKGGAKLRARSAGVRVRACEILCATREGRLEDGSACERVDLADLDALPKALDRIAPDLIVNAAAYTAVDRAEDEPDLAMRINGEAVGVLGAWAASTTRPITCSTATRRFRTARTIPRNRWAPTAAPSWPVKSPCATAAHGT